MAGRLSVGRGALVNAGGGGDAADGGVIVVVRGELVASSVQNGRARNGHAGTPTPFDAVGDLGRANPVAHVVPATRSARDIASCPSCSPIRRPVNRAGMSARKATSDAA